MDRRRTNQTLPKGRPHRMNRPYRFRVLSRLCAGTALALVPLGAVHAQSVDIDSARTETVRTSNPDGNGAADINITSGGSVEVTSGAAVVIDSSNTVTNDGTISSTVAADGIGIDVQTGSGITSGITNSATIDAIPEGNLVGRNGRFDRELINAAGAHFGIRLAGSGTFTGNILSESGGRIRAFGAGSIGIDLGAPVVGLVRNGGSLQVAGEGSVGIAVGAPLTGNLENTGTISANIAGKSTGIEVRERIDGGLLNLGSVSTGVAASFDRKLKLQQEVSGGAALAVHADITGGILNGPRTSAPDDTSGSLAALSSLGESALLVASQAPDGSGRDIAIGAVGTGGDAFAVVNRATIASSSVLKDVDVSAIRIEGADIGGTIFRVDLAGGISNQERGVIDARAADGRAVGIHIGNFATVPLIDNAGSIAARSTIFQLDTNFDGRFEEVGVGGDAIGIFIDRNATVNAIRNSGTIQVTGDGEASNVWGVLDLSGTVTSFDNSGTITVSIPAGGTGTAVAVDLSAASDDITFSNSGTIAGDVILGGGNDTVTMTGGALFGTLDFGAGAGSLRLSANASFVGTLKGSGLALTVEDSLFSISSDAPLRLERADFLGASTLTLGIFAADNPEGVLVASDRVTIGPDVAIDPNFFVFPTATDPIVLISANDLSLGAPLSDLNVKLGLSSIVFAQELATRTAGGKEQLVLNLRLRDSQEIGLSGRRAQVFDAATEVLSADSRLGTAIANIDSFDDLNSALGQLTPDITGVSRQVAVGAQNLALSALSQRFMSRRVIDDAPIPEVSEAARPALEAEIEAERKGWSYFLQEIGYFADVNADPVTGTPGYNGSYIGFMAGADKPMLGFDAVGISLMQSISEFDDDLTETNDLEVLSTQANLYASLSHKGFFLDLVGSFAYHDFSRTHIVSFANFTRQVDADWTATQFGGSAQAGFRLPLGKRVGVTLAGTVNYVRLDEGSYTEKSDGLTYEVAKRVTTSLRAGGSAGFDATFHYGSEVLIRPYLRGGYMSELDDSEITTRARFSGGTRDIAFVVPVTQDDVYFASAGVSFINRNLVVTLGYDGERATRFFSHMASLSARLRF